MQNVIEYRSCVVCTPEQVAVTINGFLIMQMAITEHNQDKHGYHKLFCDV